MLATSGRQKRQTKEQFAQRLPLLIHKIIREKEEGQVILVSRGAQEIINKNEIIYIERIKRHTCLYMEDGSMVEILLRLDDVLVLLNSINFIKCHNSFIAALPKVKKYERLGFVMKNRVIVPISRKNINSVKEQFTKWSMMQF